MATTRNLHSNIAEARARKRYDELRAAGRFAEAREMFSSGKGIGAQVLTDARATDISGDDEKFSPTPDPLY